ncbi:hypothetical protein FQG10_12530 [Escherichia coli]|nr:hypothetical protein [Escherichia coli]
MDSVHHIWCPLSSQEYQDLPDGAETTLTHYIHLSVNFVSQHIGVILMSGKQNGCKNADMFGSPGG